MAGKELYDKRSKLICGNTASKEAEDCIPDFWITTLQALHLEFNLLLIAAHRGRRLLET